MPSPKDKHNFQCVAEASVELIRFPLKDILNRQIKPKDLFVKIDSNYYLKNNLYPEQQTLCYLSPPDIPDYKKFDFTLLYTLIRNLCPKLKPRRGWGKKPRPSETEIGNDIERLRLFRNKSFAHCISAAIPDDTFKALWENLKSVLSRLKSHPECGVNYEQEMIEIKRSEFTCSKLETFKNLLQGFMILHNQAKKGGVWIKGKDEVVCGYTAEIKAKVKRSNPNCLAITWQRRRGNLVEIIDTTLQKYSGSTNTKLVIPSVCKEDACEYQASLSRESNGNTYRVYSNIIRLSVLGEMPFMEDLRVTNGNEGITIYYSFGVSEKSPKVQDIKWSKNDQPLDMSYDKFNGGTPTDDCLVIKAPSADDKGKYSCTVMNAVGSVTKDIVLDVPCITISINPTTHCTPKTTISSVVTSIPPPEEAQWKKSTNGKDFDDLDVTKPKYAGSNLNPESPRLVIPMTTLDDIIHYRLQIWNKLGANVSNDVYLKVPGSLPNITLSHETDFKDRSVKLSGAVFLSENSPVIHEVFWSINGKKNTIPRSGGGHSDVSITNPSLTINNFSTDNVDKYQLGASNAFGTNTSDVISLDAPSVNILLEKDGIEEDECICFTVEIKSIPSPSHAQWFVKSKTGGSFTPLDVNAAEYRGSTNSLPHPRLAVKEKSQLEKNCYQIEVKNFVGSTVKDISENIYRRDKIHFINLCDDLGRHFPPEKIPRLKLYVYASDKLKECASLKAANTVLEVFNVLLEENVFSKNDVIFLQLLLKKTDCEELNKKCINYASTKRVCFFESDPDNGHINLKVHVNGDLNDYTPEKIDTIIKEIALILEQNLSNIRVKSVIHSTSFLLVLSIKEADTRKLLFMREEDQLKLKRLNIDYLIVDEDILLLDGSKGIVKEKIENKRDAGTDFADFCDDLAMNFPREKLQNMKCYSEDYVHLVDLTSLRAANSPFEFFSLLLEARIFSKMNVGILQFLLKETTNCEELNSKCLEFALKHNAIHSCKKTPEEIGMNYPQMKGKRDYAAYVPLDEEYSKSSKLRHSHLSQRNESKETLCDVDISKSVESTEIGDEQNLKNPETVCQPVVCTTKETDVKSSAI